MSTDFSVTFALDETRGLIRAKAAGPIDSAGFVDGAIAFCSGLEAPWRYNRLNDLSDCTGFVSYDDLSRMAAFWAPFTSRLSIPLKVAVVTTNRLVAARLPTVEQLYTGQEHRVFTTVEEAEAWLLG